MKEKRKTTIKKRTNRTKSKQLKVMDKTVRDLKTAIEAIKKKNTN